MVTETSNYKISHRLICIKLSKKLDPVSHQKKYEPASLFAFLKILLKTDNLNNTGTILSTPFSATSDLPALTAPTLATTCGLKKYQRIDLIPFKIIWIRIPLQGLAHSDPIPRPKTCRKQIGFFKLQRNI